MKKQTHVKLNSRIFILFTVITCLIILLISMFFIRSFSQAIRVEGIKTTQSALKKSGDNLARYIGQVKELSLILENTTIIQDFFLSKDLSKKKLAEVEELLLNVVSIKSDIVSIIMVGRDGRIVSNEKNLPMELSEDMMKMPWYSETLNSNGEPVLTSAHMQDFSMDKDKWVISMSREIKAEDGSNLGLILIDLNYNVVEEVLGNLNLGDEGFLYVINDKGLPVYHEDISCFTDPEKAKMLVKEAHTKNGNSLNSVKSSYHLSNAGWLVVACTSLDSINMIKNDIVNVAIVSTIAFIVLASISAIKINRLMNDVKRKEQILRVTELSALQNQINPHFLYNSLDTIIWMAEFKEIEKVIAITGALARFFRISLNSGGVTSFGNEVEHIKQYLQIQSYRYENLLKYEINVDESLLSMKVPKLILQPIVENAIDHGIRGKKEGGTVKINASINDGAVEITVSDDGIGFDCVKNYYLPTESMLKNDVFNQEKDISNNKKKSSGVGLRNVAMRVRLFCGEKSGVVINSTIDMGTVVKILIE